MNAIYVPSLGRPDSSTLRLLKESGLEHYAVVEPHQEEEYRQKSAGTPLLVLPKSGGGIAFVRNWILERQFGSHPQPYWMLDDDITGFFITDPAFKRCLRAPVKEVLAEAEQALKSVPLLAQGALEYHQFAWGNAKPTKVCGYCDVAVLIFPKRVGEIRYRPHMELKEDRDFTLQLLAAGHMTARAAMCSFAAPKNGSNAGGLKAVYDMSGREAIASARMVEAWPGICTKFTKPDGREDVKIKWKAALASGRNSP